MTILTPKLIADDFFRTHLRLGKKDLLLEEDNNGELRRKISGPFIVMERKNSNSRIYGYDETCQAVDEYLEEWVTPNRAMGELNHPGTPRVNPERACIAIESLTLAENEKIWYGKARILKTPLGRLLETLVVEEQISLGVSSRMLGAINSITGRTEGALRVVTAADVVTDPSASQAMVEVIEESKNYIISDSEMVALTYEQLEQRLACKGLRTPVDDILEGFLSRLATDL